MKKKLILIATFLLILFYMYIKTVFAYDSFIDEIDDTENNEDLVDVFENSGDEFDIFDTDSEDVNGSMFMTGEKLDGDLFSLSITAKEITTPVLGIAFHLLYEKEKLAFLKYEPGEFLERGGDPFYLVKNDEDLSKIIFGETLRKDSTFPLGDGVIATLYFQILDGKDFSFEFNNGIISTLDTVRQDIDKIAWENFSFGKNANIAEDFGKASSLDSTSLSFSSLWVAIIMIVASIPAVYLIIRIIKKNSKPRLSAQIN